jgi:mRNA interferase MazF
VLTQADGQLKNRPALFLRVMPPYNDALLCGISTQLHQQVPDFDERITEADNDYEASGLVAASIVRLGFLSVVPQSKIVGSIGAVSPTRHRRLLDTLSRYLTAK